MPVGFSGSPMVPPACSVAGLMAVRVRLPKLPTSTSPGAAAMVWGPGRPEWPRRAAGWRRRSASRCWRRGRRRRRWRRPRPPPRRRWPPAPPRPQSARRRATCRGRPGSRCSNRGWPPAPRPCRRCPPGATATASGSTPTPTSCSDLVRGRVDLVQLVVALRHDQEVLAPGGVGQRRGQAADRDLGSMCRRARLTGVTPVPGSVTEAPVATQATLWTDVAADRLGAGRQGGDDQPRAVPGRRASGAARARSTPRAGGARRAVGRAPSGRVALGPEVAGDGVLDVGHRRRLARRPGRAARRAARRRRRSVGPEPAAGPDRTGNAAAVAALHGRPRLVDARRGRHRAGGSGTGAHRSSRAGRRSRTPRSTAPPPGRGACRPA